MDIIAKANEVRKALVAAAAVLTALVNANGVPSGVHDWAVTTLGVLAAFGITWRVTNK